MRYFIFPPAESNLGVQWSEKKSIIFLMLIIAMMITVIMGSSPQPWIVPLLPESDLHGELHLVVVDVVDRPAGETLQEVEK